MSLSATRATLELQARLSKAPAKDEKADLRAALAPKSEQDSLRAALTAKKSTESSDATLRKLLKSGSANVADEAEKDFFGDSVAVTSAQQETTDVTISIQVSGNGKVSIKS